MIGCLAFFRTLPQNAVAIRRRFEFRRARFRRRRWWIFRLHAGRWWTADEAARLRTALLVEDRIEVQLHAWRGRLWVRVSAQVYNDRSDVMRLADAVCRRL